MDRSGILKLVLAGAIVILISNALAISRDYQDSWILEGLEVPFILFVATYAFAFFSEKSASWMVALAAIGRCVFLLVPNLKYVWFQGVAIDEHLQYGLANYVFNRGYIATQGPGPILLYNTTPFIHLAFAIFSIVLSIPVVDSVKYMPVFLSPIYPLLTYVIIRNLKFPHETTALKYALFFSSIPFSLENYAVTGPQFGVLLTFLILASLMTLVQKNDRRHLFIFIFLILVLPVAHSSSSVLLATLLLAIMLLQKISHFRLKSFLRGSGIFAGTLACVAWLMFSARHTFEQILHVLFVGVPSGITPRAENIPSRFFELFRVDIFGALRTILVFNGADIFLLLLTLGGLIVLVKMRKQLNNTSNLLLLIISLMLVLVPIGLLLRVGQFRVVDLASPLFLTLSGIFVLYIGKIGKRRALMGAVIFSSMILLATLQLYRCQPLIPTANVLSKDLPATEYIIDVIQVNSIYQRQMIEFAKNYIEGQIACDHITRNQIIGLTDFNFSATHLLHAYERGWYYPLDKNQLEKEYHYFLIHLPGVSGQFGESAETRTRDLILEATYNSSIVYTNGESYVLHRNYLQTQQ